MQSYKLISGSAAEAFHLSRAKIKLYGGGFANGKTTALVARMLLIARDYPGCSILAARATYPKLNMTLRREFIKWCPPTWIKSFDKTKENTCTLINGTIIDFRYIEMRTDSSGEGTSNLLSANYDYIAVDQIDDVEITQTDFLNLLGRLRGNTAYVGDDPTMPKTGPRWLDLSCNPTLGWPYRIIVKPLHDLRNGIINENLLCERNEDGEMILDAAGKPQPIVEVFEASTYENAQNISTDYLRTLQNTYRGKMRDRYLLGKWVAFDGVVYDEFDDNIHMVPQQYIEDHLRALRQQGFRLAPVEGYDFGMAAPACYLCGVVDDQGIMYVHSGFYEPELGIDEQVARIYEAREAVSSVAGFVYFDEVFADPAIFRRTGMGRISASPTTAQLFAAQGINMVRGNNDVLNGIMRVKQRLAIQQSIVNPFTSARGCPSIFFSNTLRFVAEEYNTYRWKSQGQNEARIDEPVDRDDHAMDTIKYMCSRDVPPAQRIAKRHSTKAPNAVLRWAEGLDRDVNTTRSHRYSQ
jgi:hypothetical protein